MKSHSLLFTCFAFVSVQGIAQNQTGTPASPGTPATPTTSSQLANPNRQQELYDQYHGISKKPRRAPVTTTGSMNRTESVKPIPKTRPEQLPGPEQPERAVRTANKPVRTAPAVSDGSTSGVRIGFRGGITYPFYLESFVGINRDPAPGFTGGIVFQFGSGTLSFQPEINYTRTAYKLTQRDLFGSTTQVLTRRYGFDFVEVPLLLKIASGTMNGSRFFVNVGPYASYLLNASTEGKTQSLNGIGGRFGFGAAAGIGTALKAGPGHLTVEARGLYFLGNTDLGIGSNAKVIQSQLTLGYMVPLGGR